MFLNRQHVIVSPMCSCRLVLYIIPVHFVCQLDLRVYTSLHFHSWPCLLLCFLQQGMTPVMLAAGKGHTGVVDLLVHKYNCSLAEVDDVSVFIVLDCQSLHIWYTSQVTYTNSTNSEEFHFGFW